MRSPARVLPTRKLTANEASASAHLAVSGKRLDYRCEVNVGRREARSTSPDDPDGDPTEKRGKQRPPKTLNPPSQTATSPKSGKPPLRSNRVPSVTGGAQGRSTAGGTTAQQCGHRRCGSIRRGVG